MALLLSHSPAELVFVLAVKECSENYSLKLNAQKTKTIDIEKSEENTNFRKKGNSSVNHFEYLDALRQLWKLKELGRMKNVWKGQNKG